MRYRRPLPARPSQRVRQDCRLRAWSRILYPILGQTLCRDCGRRDLPGLRVGARPPARGVARSRHRPSRLRRLLCRDREARPAGASRPPRDRRWPAAANDFASLAEHHHARTSSSTGVAPASMASHQAIPKGAEVRFMQWFGKAKRGRPVNNEPVNRCCRRWNWWYADRFHYMSWN